MQSIGTMRGENLAFGYDLATPPAVAELGLDLIAQTIATGYADSAGIHTTAEAISQAFDNQ